MTTCYVLENKIDGVLTSISPAEYAAGAAKDYAVIDVQPQQTVANAQWVNLSAVNGPIEGLDKDAKTASGMHQGKEGLFPSEPPKAYGYTNTMVLEGGVFFNDVKAPATERNFPRLRSKSERSGMSCRIRDMTMCLMSA